jgi:2-polyprenyl-3-methyl-5-hydroxy-6-metoxy-1,4-benzoquinol methylase
MSTSNFPNTSQEIRIMAEVVDHYNASAPTYTEQYDETTIHTAAEYPANYFRLKKIKERINELGIKSVYELGIGDGSPITAIAKMGLKVGGSDFSPGMLKVAQQQFVDNGFDPELLTFGDIDDHSTLEAAIATGPYDAVMALGVLPHVASEDAVVKNMSAFIAPGGTLFLQFRNSMLSLYSFNRLTMEFIFDELLAPVSAEIKNTIKSELEPRLAMDKPPKRKNDHEGPAYDEILAKFHNPFELQNLVIANGLAFTKFHWYNYHVSPPMLASKLGQAFRDAGIELEATDDWRGMFLCSSGVIEARKN